MLRELSLFVAALFIFLYAIARLSGQVQRLFTDRVRQFISYSVRTPLSGLAIGILSTILFQSSSTTTALIVGMVSAGLLSLYHSLAILLGADIGTTVTVQLVVWKVTALFPICLAGGIPFWFAAEGKREIIGEVILYLGLILFALHLISEVTAPLKTNPQISVYLAGTAHPLFGLAAGIVFTAIVHASVIPISMVAILAQSMVRKSAELLNTFRKGKRQELAYVEAVVDNLRTEIANYLWKISDRELSARLSKQLFTYTAMVDDIERIADHAIILARLAVEKHERRIDFSDTGMARA